MKQYASLIHGGESFLGSEIQSNINFQPVWNLKTSVDCPPRFCFQITHTPLKIPTTNPPVSFLTFCQSPASTNFQELEFFPPQRENKQEPLKVKTCLYCADVPARTRLALWINFRDVCFFCQLQTHSKRAFNKDFEGDLDTAPNLQSLSQNDLENFLTIKLFRITQSPVLTDTLANCLLSKNLQRHDANNDTDS